MHHATPLITTIVGGLVLAFILGIVANKLRISPLVGYLLAGVLAGPSLRALLPIPSLPRNWLNWAHSVDVWRRFALFAEGFDGGKAIAHSPVRSPR